MASSDRPGVISLVIIVVWIQAAIAAVLGLTQLILRDDADFQARVGQDADQLLTSAIIELVLAAVLILVALGLGRGSRSVRTLVAVVMSARIAYSIFVMISQTGGAVAAAAVTIGISMFVLWALYDSEDASAYSAL